MSLFWLIISSFWFIRIIANVAAYVHLWWNKEYRFDRMWIHFHTDQGKRLLIIPWRLPHLSPKSIALIFVSLISLLVLFVWLPINIFLKLILVDILTLPVVSLLVFLVKIPTFIYHQILIQQAINKLQNHKPMIAIGVTGSYGKTSVKEFLATILATKYKVLKTSASKNSPIGIAETILNDLRDDHEVFVVEMGAYKLGEIEFMSKMVKPEIGIVTAINPQHQDLFGSIETTMQAKYELIAGLTGKQIAILNADNEYTRQMSEWAKRDKKEVWVYSRGLAKLPQAERVFLASDIKSSIEDGVDFNLLVDKQKFSVAAKVIGVHQAGNILAAAAAAMAAGMTLKEIGSAISKIEIFSKTIQPVPGINNSLFINDTFNNNPDAARAAIDVLEQAKGKKILVFQPMIELGKYAGVSHADVGEHAAKICDEVILTNRNFYSDFFEGFSRSKLKPLLQVLTPVKAVEYLRSVIKPGDTVLFKGKEAEAVLIKLKK